MIKNKCVCECGVLFGRFSAVAEQLWRLFDAASFACNCFQRLLFGSYFAVVDSGCGGP